MKLRLKRVVILCLTSVLMLVIGWTIVAHLEKAPLPRKVSTGRKSGHSNGDKLRGDEIIEDEDFSNNELASNAKPGFKKIDCLINEEYSVSCLKATDSMVYLPFNFIRKYFEVTGKLGKKEDGTEFFNWQHSYSKVFYPREPYDYRGAFLWFDNYNVEVRDRVKCLSAIHGVPISTQWDPKGHFYPIQVAQFGLSHFSKNLTLGKPRVVSLEKGDLDQDNWQLDGRRSSHQIKSIFDNQLKANNKVILVEGDAVVFKVKRRKSNDLTLSMRVKPLANFTISVVLQSETGSEYMVVYSTLDRDIVEVDDSVYYGIGSDSNWKNLTRDLGVDLQKTYSMLNKKLTFKPRNLRLTRIIFSGKALVDDVMLSSSAHLTHFEVASKWLLKNQDQHGGWPITVTRKLSNGELILNPGWYSAMAQGQALSLLTRMYTASEDPQYLEAAIKALNLFYVNSSDNGIRTYFLDKYIWYEEYPTSPSSFVLNGFIYSLFGLYDLKMACKRKACERAAHLYEEGITSLKKLLALFDTGSGSVYDLRHFSLGVAPNLARWDYHTTHINQLLYLNTIETDLILQTTAKRWIAYMRGKRAAHN